MATLNLSINIPNDKVDDLKAALLAAYPDEFAPITDPANITSAQARQVINDRVVFMLKSTYRSWKQRQIIEGNPIDDGITE